MKMFITAVFTLADIQKCCIDWNKEILADNKNELIEYFASKAPGGSITDFKKMTGLLIFDIKPMSINDAMEVVKEVPYAFILDATCRKQMEEHPSEFFVEIKDNGTAVLVTGNDLCL